MFVTEGGDEINLNGDYHTAVSWSGIGTPRTQLSTRDKVIGAGSTPDRIRLGDRNIIVNVDVYEPEPDLQERRYNEFLNRLPITKGYGSSYGTLYLKTYDNKEFAIRCALVSGLELAPPREIGGAWYYSLALSFYCPNPYFRDRNESTTGWIAVEGGGTPTPLRTPVRLSIGKPNVVLNIPYGGSADSSAVQIEIEGPAVNPKIWSLSDTPTTPVLRFDGTVTSGDLLTIRLDTHPEAQNRFYSRLRNGDSISRDSRGLPFVLRQGNNDLVYVQDNLTNADEYNNIRVSWYNEYLAAGN